MNPHAHMKGQSGVCMARHTVFDGIDLLFLDVKRETIQFFAQSHTKTFAINHCEEGVLNANSHLENTCIWGQGDMSLGWHIRSDYQHENYFPTKSFKGIVLLVDVERAQHVLDTLVADTQIDLTAIANRFFVKIQNFGMMMEETESGSPNFSSLYNVPDHIRSHYFKKIVEIFFLLSVISTDSHEKRGSYRKQQVDIVKAVSKYLSTRISSNALPLMIYLVTFDVPASTLNVALRAYMV